MYQQAIAQLEDSASICENNAPIREAEGRHEQAEHSAFNAKNYREAIALLESAMRARPH